MMKFTAFFILIFVVQLSANVYSQQTKLKVDFNQATIKEVIDEIEKQTDLTFFFSGDVLNIDQTVTLNEKSMSIADILDQVGEQTGLSLVVLRDQILVKNTNPPNYSINQQHKSISGKVTDLSGLPLPGVTVIIKGTTQGTVTDADGIYSIMDVPNNSTLIISFVGMRTQEIVLTGQDALNIVLEEETIGIEEVVAIGYGSQKKKEITSSIANVSSEDFNQGNITNSSQLLQGKVAGLSITSPQGDPNGIFDIRLRGVSTLGANASPLIIVDGVIGVDFNSVDPNDIESIDILKDASAAAIYGTRGSSGVILITTKQGKKGELLIEYNGYVSAEKKARSLSVMNANEFKEIGGADFGGNTEWINEISRTAISHDHGVSLSGGTDYSTYRVSLNYQDAKGVLLNSGFNKLNGRVNFTQKAFDNKLSLTLNLATTSKNAKLGFPDAFKYAAYMPPTAPIRSIVPVYETYDGYFQSQVFDLFNPVAIVKQNTNNQEIDRLMYNIQLDYMLLDGLKLSGHYSRNNTNSILGQYVSKTSYYGDGINRNGLATRNAAKIKDNLFESTLSFVRGFSDFNLSLLGGYSFQDIINESFLEQGGDFLSDAFTYNNIGASSDFAAGKGVVFSSKERNKLIAFFGRLNLTYKNAYFLSATIRREGSTRFGKGNKWGNFPAISIGTDIAQLYKLPNVDNLKLRASYGVTGNMPSESYLSLMRYGPGSIPVYGANNVPIYFLYEGEWTQVYGPLSNPNPELKWETKQEFDVGLDISMFKSRLTGTFDFYNRTSKDLLITLPVPVPPNLFETSLLNVGELKNRGFELALNYKFIDHKKFSWLTGITYSSYNTKIVSLSAGEYTYGTRYVGLLNSPVAGTNVIRVQEGRPLGEIYGPITEGLDENGQFIYKDINGDGTINNLDQDVIGRGLPKGEIGLTNTITWKNFDLNFFIRGVYGHDLVNVNRIVNEPAVRSSSYNIVNTKYFQPEYKGTSVYNDYYVEDADFIKLDNATIGYNLNLSNNKNFSKVRLYLSIQNLFVISNYSGVDPEVRYVYRPWYNPIAGAEALAPGIEDQNTWFTTRNFTFGLNVSF